MKVLMFSEDKNILKPGSDVVLRMEEYANVLGELHVVVSGEGEKAKSTYLYIYPAPRRALGALRNGWKLCRLEKFNVLTVQATDDIGLVGFFLSHWFKIPFQLQLHTDVMSPWYRKGSVKEWIKYRIAKFLIPRADIIRVVSERIRRSIFRDRNVDTFSTRSATSRGGLANYQQGVPMSTSGTKLPCFQIVSKSIKHSINNMYVLPIFTDLTKYSDSKRNSDIDRRLSNYEFKMIAVGRFVEKEKNFLMLIDVMREFVQVCPKALLVIVGGGQDKAKYESRIRDYGLARNIILEPWRDDLHTFYKSFDLFLLSSQYEGWGRVVLEAMASGLPVVMTDVGLAGEVVKNNENGRVTPVGDTQAMFEAVIDLYKNPEKRKKFMEIGLITIKQLLGQNKEEYLKKYRESFEIVKQN